MTTLTDRYVDAAMRTVPDKQRADLAAELRASIDDQVDARVAAGEDPAVAERTVLSELGEPEVLAAGYVDRPLHLIGPRYYLTWWRLTKLLWAIIPACVGFAVALGQVVSGANPGSIVGHVVSTMLAVVVHIGFWTTLVFAVLERSVGSSEPDFPKAWTPDDLPEPKDSGATLGDAIGTLVCIVALAGAVLWDRFFGFVYTGEDGWMSFFAAGLWPWWATAFFVLLGASGALALWVYARGRWTYGAAAVNLVLAALVAGGVSWLLANDALIDPGLFARLIPEDGDQVARIVGIVFAFATVGVAAWSAVDAFLKARRSRRPGTPAAAALG